MFVTPLDEKVREGFPPPCVQYELYLDAEALTKVKGDCCRKRARGAYWLNDHLKWRLMRFSCASFWMRLFVAACAVVKSE